jgi:hypothetical protein
MTHLTIMPQTERLRRFPLRPPASPHPQKRTTADVTSTDGAEW